MLRLEYLRILRKVLIDVLTCSWNHRMAGLEGTLKGHLVQPPSKDIFN